MPDLLRGSVISLHHKCGKPNCRCAAGEPHRNTGGVVLRRTPRRTKTMTLRDDEAPAVEAALARYQAAADSLRNRRWRAFAR